MSDSPYPDSPSEFRLLVDGQRWERVPSFDSSGPDEHVFMLDPKRGEIIFGDGVNGRTPPVGSRLEATYSFGGGEDGNIGSTHGVGVEWKVTNDFLGAVAAVFEPRATGALFHIVSSEKSCDCLIVAEMLYGKLNAIRKLKFSDLVLSVLPWPFNKELPIVKSLSISKLDLLRLYLCGRLCRSIPTAALERLNATTKGRNKVWPRRGSYTVKAGDELPLITYDIYGDPHYYLEVARANKLTDFRNLRAGTTLHFPPVDKRV